MAKEIGMNELEEMCRPKSPAAELQDLLKEVAKEHLVDEFIEEDIDEEYILMLKALNLTARTLGMLDELESEVRRLRNDLIEVKAKLDVLEVERRFEHNKDGG